MTSAGRAALAGDARSQEFGLGQPRKAVRKSDFEIRVECRFTPARRPRKLARVLKSTWVGVLATRQMFLPAAAPVYAFSGPARVMSCCFLRQ